MLDTICTLPLAADIFTQALHPSEPILSVGLSSGHVYTYRLPAVDEADDDNAATESSAITKQIHESTVANGHAGGPHPIISSIRRSSTASENGLGSIQDLWKTRRHKGSCRALAFNHDGNSSYSAGTDDLVKAYDTATGKVTWKVALADSDGGDAPSSMYALSPQALLLGTDEGKLYVYDLRQAAGTKPSNEWAPHGVEPVNDICSLPIGENSTSGFPKQWVSVGGSTVAVADIRKGILHTSEDQEVELTRCLIVQGLKKGGTSVGEKLIVGQSDGVLSLWEKGVWGDLDERIVIDRHGEGVDSLCEVPDGLGKGKSLRMDEKIVAAGLANGQVRFARIGRNGVLHSWEIVHDELEGVATLGFDVGNRLISGGGQTIKIWTQAKGRPGGGKNTINGKRAYDSESSDGEDGEEEEDEQDEGASFDQESEDEDSQIEDEKLSSKRKKRKRNKGKDRSGGLALSFSGTF